MPPFPKRKKPRPRLARGHFVSAEQRRPGLERHVRRLPQPQRQQIRLGRGPDGTPRKARQRGGLGQAQHI